jgi:hypothetical protein
MYFLAGLAGSRKFYCYGDIGRSIGCLHEFLGDEDGVLGRREEGKEK